MGLSVAKGYSPDYLTKEISRGMEGYYTGAEVCGEPPGQWQGAGAEALGLVGAVDNELFEGMYSRLLDPADPASQSRDTWDEARTLGRPANKQRQTVEERYQARLAKEPRATPERCAELRREAEAATKTAVLFYDLTYDVSKSISVFWASCERRANECRANGDAQGAAHWSRCAKEVEAAVMEGAAASISHMEREAGWHQIGHHGGGAEKWDDAHAWVVSSFLQHDSREHDPQLHVHQAVLNRSLGADGKWRAIHGRAIYREKMAASRIGERVTEARLIERLGVSFETREDTVNGGVVRELVGVTAEQRQLFSKSTKRLSKRAEKDIAAFRERKGREPNAVEDAKIRQHANLKTRGAKSRTGETEAERFDRWEREAQQIIAGGMSTIAGNVMAAAKPGLREKWSVTELVEHVIDKVKDIKHLPTRAEYVRRVAEAMPANPGVSPENVDRLVNRVTDQVIDRVVPTTDLADDGTAPAELRRRDGTSKYVEPGAMRYASPGTIAEEQALRRAAQRNDRMRFSTVEVDAQLKRLKASGVTLRKDQEAALRGVLTSGSRVGLLAAGAGCGKSFAVGAINAAWEGAGGKVIGLATSQAATEVLADEGLEARNIESWLLAQDRLDSQGCHDDDLALKLGKGSLVIVDEGSMVNTSDIHEINRRVEAAQARLLVVGDAGQNPAIGQGGVFADLLQQAPHYKLADPIRFNAEWEGDASLRLRDGDTSAINEYAKHGRVRAGGTAEQTEQAAVRAWLADHLSGKEALILAGSNDQVARVNSAIRDELVSLGKVAEHGVELGRDGNIAGVGDVVVARRNGWDLVGPDCPQAPINQLAYRVLETRPDGGMVVEREGTHMALPRDYVSKHVTLGYAGTEHSAQGRTVDVCHALVSLRTRLEALYVALTRGKWSNTAWAETVALPTDAEAGQAKEVEETSAHAVLAKIVKGGAERRVLSALSEMEKAGEQARSVRTAIDRLNDGVNAALDGRLGRYLDHLAADGSMTPDQRAEVAASPDATRTLERLMRQVELAGHNPAEVLGNAVRERNLVNARSFAQVINHRIRAVVDLTPKVLAAVDLIPAGIPDRWRQHLQGLADAADRRRAELGTKLAQDPPKWATDALGAVPADPVRRLEWEDRASWGGAYRELAGRTHETDALGNAPAAGLAETRAMWKTAHAALELPNAEEAEMSVAALRARVRAADREDGWAPEYVADKLEQASEQLRDREADAVLWRERAKVNEGKEAEQLLAAAEKAEQEAVELQARVAELEAQDSARADWLSSTIRTRDLGERAFTEAAKRGVDLHQQPDDMMTGDEWLAAHDEAMRAEDPHRRVTETDVAEPAGQVEQVEVVEHDHELDTAVPDARESAEEDPVRRAQLAVTEVAERTKAEETEQADRQVRWDTEAAEHDAAAVQEDGPALERV